MGKIVHGPKQVDYDSIVPRVEVYTRHVDGALFFAYEQDV